MFKFIVGFCLVVIMICLISICLRLEDLAKTERFREAIEFSTFNAEYQCQNGGIHVLDPKEYQVKCEVQDDSI